MLKSIRTGGIIAVTSSAFELPGYMYDGNSQYIAIEIKQNETAMIMKPINA